MCFIISKVVKISYSSHFFRPFCCACLMKNMKKTVSVKG